MTQKLFSQNIIKTLRIFLFAAIFVAIGFLSLPRASYAQITNGTFTGGAGIGWTDVLVGDGSVLHNGTQVVVTGDNTGVNGSYNATSQGISLTEAGVVNFTLVSYSSTDSGNWDSPQVNFDGTLYSISTAGNLVGSGSGVQNSSQGSVNNLVSRGFFGSGAHTLQFGVFTVDGVFGAGISTWDNVQYQELTQSPGAQTTPFNTLLTLASSPQVPTNMGTTNTTVTLSVTSGVINLGSTAGISISSGANGSSSLTFNGTPAAINNALSGMSYTPNTGFSGSDTLVFSANVVGTNSTISDTDNIPITVVLPTYTYTLNKTRSLGVATAAGQTINYSITLTSTGNGSVTGVSIADSLAQTGGSSTALTVSGPTGNSAPLASLDPGEVWVYSATHNVTQPQMDNGGDLINTATVSSDQGVTLPASSPATTLTTSPLLSMSKLAYEGGLPPALGGTGTLAAANRPVNTLITYVYQVSNNGNITIDNVQINDVHNGSGNGGTTDANHLSLTDNAPTGDSPDGNADNAIWGTLAPGDVITFTGTYTVTQSDIDSL
ncbi:MAG: beta strand repeat-containing protein [Hyphomicrobiales bacterium]